MFDIIPLPLLGRNPGRGSGVGEGARSCGGSAGGADRRRFREWAFRTDRLTLFPSPLRVSGRSGSRPDLEGAGIAHLKLVGSRSTFPEPVVHRQRIPTVTRANLRRPAFVADPKLTVRSSRSAAFGTADIGTYPTYSTATGNVRQRRNRTFAGPQRPFLLRQSLRTFQTVRFERAGKPKRPSGQVYLIAPGRFDVGE